MRRSALGIYIHVPWCRRRCPYCDFYFEVGAPVGDFAHAVGTELAARREERSGRPAETIYFGGGTPSLLGVPGIASVLAEVRNHIDVVANAEVTVEVNPEDCPPGFCDALRGVGVTRLSIGAQSFDDDALRSLGRVHSGVEAQRVVSEAAASGPTSVDLIVGLPAEQAGRRQRDVELAAEAGAQHVSAYLLTVETGTPLARRIQRGQAPAPNDDDQANAYEHIGTLLLASGLRHYEVSSWARPGAESQHNRSYWHGADYVGLGPGAASRRRLPDGSVVYRHNTPALRPWLATPAAASFDEERLDPAHAIRERIAFGLRDLADGVDVDAVLLDHGGVADANWENVVASLAQEGLLQRRDQNLRLTAEGARFADRAARAFLQA